MKQTFEYSYQQNMNTNFHREAMLGYYPLFKDAKNETNFRRLCMLI